MPLRNVEAVLILGVVSGCSVQQLTSKENDRNIFQARTVQEQPKINMPKKQVMLKRFSLSLNEGLIINEG